MAQLGPSVLVLVAAATDGLATVEGGQLLEEGIIRPVKEIYKTPNLRFVKKSSGQIGGKIYILVQ